MGRLVVSYPESAGDRRESAALADAALARCLWNDCLSVKRASVAWVRHEHVGGVHLLVLLVASLQATADGAKHCDQNDDQDDR